MDRHTGDSWTAVSPIIEMNWILSYRLSVVYGSAYWRQLDCCLADYRNELDPFLSSFSCLWIGILETVGLLSRRL